MTLTMTSLGHSTLSSSLYDTDESSDIQVSDKSDLFFNGKKEKVPSEYTKDFERYL